MTDNHTDLCVPSGWPYIFCSTDWTQGEKPIILLCRAIATYTVQPRVIGSFYSCSLLYCGCLWLSNLCLVSGRPCHQGHFSAECGGDSNRSLWAFYYMTSPPLTRPSCPCSAPGSQRAAFSGEGASRGRGGSFEQYCPLLEKRRRQSFVHLKITAAWTKNIVCTSAHSFWSIHIVTMDCWLNVDTTVENLYHHQPSPFRNAFLKYANYAVFHFYNLHSFHKSKLNTGWRQVENECCVDSFTKGI